MSQQDRGRGRNMGGFEQRRGRGGFHSHSPHAPQPHSSYPPQTHSPHAPQPHSSYPPQTHSPYPPQQHFTNFDVPPGSSYPPSQPSSSIHPAHPYPGYSVSQLPQQLPAQSIISLAVIQSAPQSTPQPVQIYSDRQPPQSSASYFQPNPGSHVPPKHGDYAGQTIRSEPYPYDDRYMPNHPHQQQYHPREHYHETRSTHYFPPEQSSTDFGEYSSTRQEHDIRTGQQKYKGPRQEQHNRTGQRKYSGPLQEHDIRTGQRKYSVPRQEQSTLSNQEKINSRQKQAHYSGKKHGGSQQKPDLNTGQRSVARDPPRDEPPPAYESLNFKPTDEHSEKMQKTGKKFREMNPQNKMKDKSKTLQEGLVSDDGGSSIVRGNSKSGKRRQHLHQVGKDVPGLDNNAASSKQNPNAQAPRGLSESFSRDIKENHLSQADKPKTGEPVNRDIQVKEGLKTAQSFKQKSSHLSRELSDLSVEEREIPPSNRGRGRMKGRGNFQGKSQPKGRKNVRMSDLENRDNFDPSSSYERTGSDTSNSLLTGDIQMESQGTTQDRMPEKEFAQNKKSKKSKKKKTKGNANHSNYEQQSEEPSKVSSGHLTKASLQILTHFKDVASFKETLERNMDKTQNLEFVDDSIICSEKRGVGTVTIKAVSSHAGANIVKDLCERLRRSLNTKVTYDISGSGQENSQHSEGDVSDTRSSQELADHSLDIPATVKSSESEHRNMDKYGEAEFVEMAEDKSPGLNEGNLELSDKEGSDDEEVDSSEDLGEDNSEDEQVENDVVADKENSGDEQNSSEVDNSEDEEEENSESAEEENSEYTDEDTEEDNGDGLGEENNDDLGQEKKAGLDESSESLNKQWTSTPTKLSFVVDRVFPVHNDFLELLSCIFGNKVSLFELLPDSVVMATSTTLCELMAPSKKAAREIVKIVNICRLEGMQVRCFIVNDGSDST